MKIANGRVVALEYRLHLGDGQVIDQSAPGQPLAYLHGHKQIVPGLEGALDGLGVGESKQVVVAPDQGYGNHNPEGVRTVPRSMLPAGLHAPGGPDADGADGGRQRPPAHRDGEPGLRRGGLEPPARRQDAPLRRHRARSA